MAIQKAIEKQECYCCDNEVHVVVMRDDRDEEAPELFQLPQGAFMTAMVLDESGDDSWVFTCSDACAQQLLEEEFEGDEEEEAP